MSSNLEGKIDWWLFLVLPFFGCTGIIVDLDFFLSVIVIVNSVTQSLQSIIYWFHKITDTNIPMWMNKLGVENEDSK